MTIANILFYNEEYLAVLMVMYTEGLPYYALILISNGPVLLEGLRRSCKNTWPIEVIWGRGASFAFEETFETGHCRGKVWGTPLSYSLICKYLEGLAAWQCWSICEAGRGVRTCQDHFERWFQRGSDLHHSQNRYKQQVRVVAEWSNTYTCLVSFKLIRSYQLHANTLLL